MLDKEDIAAKKPGESNLVIVKTKHPTINSINIYENRKAKEDFS